MVPFGDQGIDRVLTQERSVIGFPDRVQDPRLPFPELSQVTSVRTKKTSAELPADHILPIVLLSINDSKLDRHQVIMNVTNCDL